MDSLKPAVLLKGFIIIVCIQFVSLLLVVTFNILLPSALLGMIILTILLLGKIVPMKAVEGTCNVLLYIMSLLFIPPVISLTLYYDIISREFLPIVITMIISTIIVMLVTGKTVQIMIERKQKRLEK